MEQFIKPEPSSDALRRNVLSLILCSRNDQYMGNSIWRLQTTLNYVAEMVHELKREAEVEVLVSDWGSDIPLQQVIELSPAAARIVSFLHVPPRIAHDLQKDSPFPEVLALNAAARRASGEYIGRIDQDTLVGKRFLDYFFALYEGREKLEVPINSALLFSNRRNIPYRFAVRCPSLNQVDAYVKWFGKSLKVWKENQFYEEVFWASYVGIWLLHRDLWQACGGYDERLIYYNWMEVDMILRLMQNNKITDLGRLTAYDFYHLEHYDPRTSLQARIHAKKNPDFTPGTRIRQLNPNGAEWGMITYPLEIKPWSSFRAGAEPMDIEAEHLKLPAFFFLILTTWTETVFDNLILYLQDFWSVWKTRRLVAREAIQGEPFIKWPRLLVMLWMQRKSAKKKVESIN